MKRVISIVAAAGLLLAAGAASANSPLAITVHQDRFAPADCTPPNSSRQCAEFHAAIRSHFSQHEIGMLFGAATAYPEFRASFDRARAKYAAFLHEVGGEAVALR